MNMTLASPLISPMMAGPVPRYGTCTSLTFAMLLNSSAARCGVLPLPEPAYITSPGRAFASEMSCVTEVAGSEGCTTSRLGESASRLTGSKSFTGS
jgi:hypothetical protein